MIFSDKFWSFGFQIASREWLKRWGCKVAANGSVRFCSKIFAALKEDAINFRIFSRHRPVTNNAQQCWWPIRYLQVFFGYSQISFGIVKHPDRPHCSAFTRTLGSSESELLNRNNCSYWMFGLKNIQEYSVNTIHNVLRWFDEKVTRSGLVEENRFFDSEAPGCK